MSPNKVKKHIRAQRKLRKQQARQEQRAARQEEKLAKLPEEKRQELEAKQEQASGNRVGQVGAVVVGLGIIAAGAGSAGLEFINGGASQPSAVSAHYEPAPAVPQRLVCPPMPGEPDSLSEQGVLEYDDRDDSAQLQRLGLLFAAADGRTPASDWVPLTQEGRGEAESITEAGEDSENDDAATLAERSLTPLAQDEGPGSTVLQVQTLEEVAPEDAPAALSGLTYQADSGAVTGLAAAECVEPQRNQWFLGPETGSGANSLLTLANPYDRDATVEVTTYSPEGATGDLGRTSLLVPADSVRTVNMAALTDGENSLAVEVAATGAPVAAHLQSSRADGGTGEGTELLSGQAEPRQQHHHLGVPVGHPERDPELWFHNPSDEVVTVELQAYNQNGQAATETPGVFHLDPGQVSVLGLHGLETGTYELVMNSDQPLYSAVRSAGDGEAVEVEEEETELDPITGEPLEPQEDEGEPAPDFSWTAPVEGLQEGSGALFPQAAEGELRLLAPPGETPAEVTYRLFDAAGNASEELSAEILPGTSAVVEIDELAEQAEDAGLDEVFALVVTDVEGEAYGGILAVDSQGQFTSIGLNPIGSLTQYVPMWLVP